MWGTGGRRPGLLRLLKLLGACPASFQSRVRPGAPLRAAGFWVSRVLRTPWVLATHPPPWALVSVLALRPSMTLCGPLAPVALRPLRLPKGGTPLLRVLVTAPPCGLHQLRFYHPPGLCVLTGLSTGGVALSPAPVPPACRRGGTRRPSPLLSAGPLPLLCPPA